MIDQSSLMLQIQKLRDEISNLTFIEKIHWLLSYTKKNPDTILSIGLYWADSSGTFAVNSLILSNVLGIKTNSVNKNFLSIGISKLKSGCLSQDDLPDKRTWCFRKATNFNFLPETERNELRSLAPLYRQTSKSSPLPRVRTLDYKPTISMLSKLTTRSQFWIDAFEKCMKKQWLELNDHSQNTLISISHVIEYLSKNSTWQNFQKLTRILKFFSNNSDFIDINGYYIFCSFFGIKEKNNVLQTINQFPLQSQGQFNKDWDHWMVLSRSSPILEKCLLDQNNQSAWIVTLSNEPGEFLLLRKMDRYIAQTKLYFDCLDNVYYTKMSLGPNKTYSSLNSIIRDYLNLELRNLMEVELLNSLVVHTKIETFRSDSKRHEANELSLDDIMI